MPKGFSNVIFVNGPHDGLETEAPAIALSETVYFDSDVFYSHLENGDVAIMKGKRTPSIRWFCFNRHMYIKRGKNQDKIVYEYSETISVDRCEALTQKGKRCGHEAIQGSCYCHTHNKHSADSTTPSHNLI